MAVRYEEAVTKWFAKRIKVGRHAIKDVKFYSRLDCDGCDTCGFGSGFYTEATAIVDGHHRTVELHQISFEELLKEILDQS